MRDNQGSSCCHKVVLAPKSPDVKMLDMSYEVHPAPSIRSSGSIPINPDDDWDSSLFVHLRGMKIITMYGFLMIVRDFILAPLSQTIPKRETETTLPQATPRMFIILSIFTLCLLYAKE